MAEPDVAGIGAVIGSGISRWWNGDCRAEAAGSSILNAPLLQYLITHSTSFGRPGAGPAIAISFIWWRWCAGCFGLLCGACGDDSDCRSAYTYTYATMGELIAWIIGWDLILEYAVSNMAVSVGFSAHIVDLLDWFGWHPDPKWISRRSSDWIIRLAGNMIYGPVALRVQLAGIHHRDAADGGAGAGIKESAETNNIMGASEDCAILVFVGFAARFIKPAHWHPFAPNGWPGF